MTLLKTAGLSLAIFTLVACEENVLASNTNATVIPTTAVTSEPSDSATVTASPTPTSTPTATPSISLTATPVPNTVLKYATWRKQEIPMFDYVNANDLIPGVDVEVVLIDPNNYEAGLQLSLDNNSLDLFTVKSAGKSVFSTYAQAIAGIDTSNLVANTAYTNEQGELLGVPFALQLESLQYDKAVFDQYGYAVPTNMAEFNQLLLDALEDGLTPIGAAEEGWFNNQVLNEVIVSGLVSQENVTKFLNAELCFNDDVFVQAYQQVADMNIYTTNYSGNRVPFALGEVLFKVDGAWVTATVGAEYQANPFLDWGFMAIPGAGNKMVSHIDGYVMAAASSPNTTEVAQFLQFLTSPTYGQLLIDEIADTPVMVSQFQVSNDVMQKKLDALATATGLSGYLSDELNAGSPSYQSLIASYLGDLVNKQISAQDFVDTVQAGLNQWHTGFAQSCPVAN